MLRMPKPDLDPIAVYTACTSTARPVVDRAELQKLTLLVADAVAEYERAAASGAQHNLAHLQYQPGGKPVKTVEGKLRPAGINGPLINGYSSRMVPEESVGRDYYDRLVASAPDGRCPLCAHGVADTLDHQLPKSIYPLLAVAPANLVPACSRCNTKKRDLAPATSEDQTLHPYFDHDVQQYTWLAARIIGPPKPSVVFQSDPPPDMPPVLAARVRHHFTVLRLRDLYGSQAGPQMRVLSRRLTGKSSDLIRAHLYELLEGWERENPNCWQAALHRALAGSDWYIDHGHREPWSP